MNSTCGCRSTDCMNGGSLDLCARAWSESNFSSMQFNCRAINLRTKDETEPAIVIPHQHDVFLGRGNNAKNNIGNIHYRAIVDMLRFDFLFVSKRERAMLAEQVVEMIHSLNPPGRFLGKYPGSKGWYIIDDRAAMRKVSQALREGAPQLSIIDRGDVKSLYHARSKFLFLVTEYLGSGNAGPDCLKKKRKHDETRTIAHLLITALKKRPGEVN